MIEGIHLASTGALICLKAKAYLDLKQRKENGEEVDSRNIKKHRLDVIRLGAILTNENIDNLPLTLKDDLSEVIEELKGDLPDGKTIGKNLGAGSLNVGNIIQQLEKTFHLQN